MKILCADREHLAESVLPYLPRHVYCHIQTHLKACMASVTGLILGLWEAISAQPSSVHAHLSAPLNAREIYVREGPWGDYSAREERCLGILLTAETIEGVFMHELGTQLAGCVQWFK